MNSSAKGMGRKGKANCSVNHEEGIQGWGVGKDRSRCVVAFRARALAIPKGMAKERESLRQISCARFT